MVVIHCSRGSRCSIHGPYDPSITPGQLNFAKGAQSERYLIQYGFNSNFESKSNELMVNVRYAFFLVADEMYKSEQMGRALFGSRRGGGVGRIPSLDDCISMIRIEKRLH